jgi:hypothetical protein
MRLDDTSLPHLISVTLSRAKSYPYRIFLSKHKTGDAIQVLLSLRSRAVTLDRTPKQLGESALAPGRWVWIWSPSRSGDGGGIFPDGKRVVSQIDPAWAHRGRVVQVDGTVPSWARPGAHAQHTALI